MSVSSSRPAILSVLSLVMLLATLSQACEPEINVRAAPVQRPSAVSPPQPLPTLRLGVLTSTEAVPPPPVINANTLIHVITLADINRFGLILSDSTNEPQYIPRRPTTIPMSVEATAALIAQLPELAMLPSTWTIRCWTACSRASTRETIRICSSTADSFRSSRK